MPVSLISSSRHQNELWDVPVCQTGRGLYALIGSSIESVPVVCGSVGHDQPAPLYAGPGRWLSYPLRLLEGFCQESPLLGLLKFGHVLREQVAAGCRGGGRPVVFAKLSRPMLLHASCGRRTRPFVDGCLPVTERIESHMFFIGAFTA